MFATHKIVIINCKSENLSTLDILMKWITTKWSGVMCIRFFFVKLKFGVWIVCMSAISLSMWWNANFYADVNRLYMTIKPNEDLLKCLYSVIDKNMFIQSSRPIKRFLLLAFPFNWMHWCWTFHFPLSIVFFILIGIFFSNSSFYFVFFFISCSLLCNEKKSSKFRH